LYAESVRPPPGEISDGRAIFRDRDELSSGSDLSQVIKNKELSASQFADEIGVQRSSVSHVLSGRNKPSLDFITKVILRFPEINSEWLLTGRGIMFSSAGSNESVDVLSQTPAETLLINASVKDSEEQAEYKAGSAVDVSKIEKAGRAKTTTGSDTIEKIVFFYTDGTFSEYTPGK
jgi:transcriptional regulator with XRE-family HTH domain